MMASISETVPTIPDGAVFQYLAEGAANIVYRISSPLRPSTPEESVAEKYGAGTPPPSLIDVDCDSSGESILQDRLIRFRKDLPTTAPCAVAQASWERLIKPLFPPHQLVDQVLVDLRPGQTIRQLNHDLQDWENGKPPTNASLDPTSPRPTKRQRIYLANDDHALLVKDMTPHDDEYLVEFKPKWLLLSPSAPQGSKRCRQCARMARINAEHAHKREPLVSFFCPLDLISQKKKKLKGVASLIMEPGADDIQINRFTQWLEHTDILDNLKARQVELDSIGVLNGDAGDERLLAAMTLRDCTVFVKCTGADPREWEARIGDLDLKSKDKIGYWRSIENLLIDEGWYQGLESEENRQPVVCRLRKDPNRSKGLSD